MAGFSLNSLSNIPVLGPTLDDLTGKKGAETAAAGAKEAQKQMQALSELQWNRQMEGLSRAQGSMSTYHSLYDKIYGTKTAQPSGGSNISNVDPVTGQIRAPVTGIGRTTTAPDSAFVRGAQPAGSGLRTGPMEDALHAMLPGYQGRPLPTPATPAPPLPAGGAGFGSAPSRFRPPGQ